MALARGVGNVLHVLVDEQAMCGTTTTTLEGVTDDDLLCHLCMRQIDRGEIDPGPDALLALDDFLADRLAKLPYHLYLRTSHWKKMRQLALDHYGRACVLCNNGDVDVHHRTYDRLGRERLDDLIVLCRDCHGRHHAAA